ncbi:unnamed protein product [Orchesella dallaii]|uniref:Lipase domain-containing protein n=1 Tax=Orchesella dallaii TaxID=48710 RepID=A0ABP1QUR9_9HEXA
MPFENHSRTLNVVFVNWRSISYLPWYFWAARNVPLVGAYAAKFLAFLIDEGKTSIDNIHIIGHSLGSHVASHAGRNVKGEKVSRITGARLKN